MTVALLCASLLLAAAPDGGTLSPNRLVRPVHINADQLSVFNKHQRMVWQGHVRARRDALDLACDRMTAHYTGDQSQITQAVCDGHVVVVEGDRWGKGDHADFDNLSGVLVVTGAPEAHQGRSAIKGTKVTFFVGTDQLDVEHASAIVEQGKERPALPKASRRAPSGK